MNRYVGITVTIFILTSALFLLDASIVTAQVGAPIVEGEYKLVLTPSTPYFPSDGGRYPIMVQIQNAGGEPRVLMSDVVIELSSSNVNIGSTESTLLFRAGTFYAALNFTSTLTIGSTNITATAPGLQSSAVIVNTVGISGTPVTLTVYGVPDKVPARVGMKSLIIVELQDANGLPSIPGRDVTVFLHSSETRIGSVDATVVINENSSFGIAYFYPTNQEGTTTILVAASGLTPAKVDITTTIYQPNILKVYLLPPILPTASSGTVIVQIQNPKGQPIVAPNDVNVMLSSSNTPVAKLESNQLIIPKGRTYASIRFTTGYKGDATIYAIAQGYESGYAPLSVMSSSSSQGGKLMLYAGPPMIPDSSSHTILALLLVDDNLTPIRAVKTVEAFLSSSSLRVGSIEEKAYIQKENSYTLLNFTTRDVKGSTIITAIADDFEASQVSIDVVEEAVFKTVVTVYPSNVPIGISVPPVTLVQIQDDAGNPAFAPADLDVKLYSSNTQVGSVDARLTVRQGENYGVTKFYSTDIWGSTTITAATFNYIPTESTVSTFKAGAFKLSLYLEPSIILADGSRVNNVFVQLQDIFGFPVEAKRDTQITLSSSDAVVGEVEESTVLAKGSTFTVAGFKTANSVGSTQITVHTPGLQSSSRSLSLTLLPLDISLSAPSSTIRSYDELPLQVNVSLDGQPVKGVAVNWVPSQGTITAVDSVTDSKGVAKATFMSIMPGSAQIKAVLSKAGYQTAETPVLSVKINPRALKVGVVPAKLETRAYDELEIALNVLDEGKPVPDATVDWKATPGTLKVKNNVTDGDGLSKATFTHNDVVTAKLSYLVVKKGYLNATGSLSITVKPAPLKLELQVEASTIEVGKESKIVAISTSDGRRVDNVNLSWNASIGTLSTQVTRTDSNGFSQVVFSHQDEGVSTITVKADKKGYTSARSTAAIEIIPPPFPAYLATPLFWQKFSLPLGVVVAVCVIGFLSFRYIRRRRAERKKEEEVEMEESSPPSS